MNAHLPRRAVLAALPGLALAAATRESFADRVYVPTQLPMSVSDLAKIGDDENAVMDALTYLMWRAPSMQDVVRVAPVGQKLQADNINYKTYSVPYADGGPFGIQPTTDPELAALTDKLAVLFTCEFINSVGGVFANAINPEALSNLLGKTANSDAAYRLSNAVYLGLLLQTKADPRPGAQTFFQAKLMLPPRGPALAEFLTSDAFIQVVLARPPELARRELCVDRYKLKRLGAGSLESVDKRWSAPDLKGSVFPLAVQDPWPPNYFAKLYADRVKPMAPLVGLAMNAVTSVDVGKRCHMHALAHKCNNNTMVDVRGDAVWQVLVQKAAPLGLLGHPNYPDGVNP